MRKYFLRECPNCTKTGISVFSVANAVSGSTIFCKECNRRFDVGGGTKSLVALLAALFIPFFVILFPSLGFIKGIVFLLAAVSIIYYFILIKAPLKERRLIDKTEKKKTGHPKNSNY